MDMSLKDAIRNICSEPQRTAAPAEPDENAVRNEAARAVREILSDLLRVPEEMLEDDGPLDEFGIDSMLTIKIMERIEEVFGPQRKTLLYEYGTIEELSGFFADHSAERIRTRLKDRRTDGAPAEAPAAAGSGTGTVPAAPDPAMPVRDGAPELGEAIAIIGLSGRYPGARNVEQFWENLEQGKDCITPIPADYWDTDLYFSRFAPEEKPYLKEGGFLDGVYEFDPMFFAISPNDARNIDPQERLFLECCYEAMEDAGYTREGLNRIGGPGKAGMVGVFAGAMNGEYRLFGAQEQVLGNPSKVIGHASSVANRVSYFLNLHGPSFTVDTMCSASLTALHLACRSLSEGECGAAFVGGVNLSIHPMKYHHLCSGKFLSPHGRCQAFGATGDGYVPAEGVGAVLIRPLKDALAAGDHIYGVIRGTAVNHGGKTSGYTVPNPNAQADVIDQALARAGVTADTLSYVEAHGTGTKLGDPIEIAGLEQVFRRRTDKKQFCAIGSVKSNIGHAEGAAGMAGLTKVLLQMQHGKIVPSLHSKTLNPYIDFAASPFFVPQSLTDWKRPAGEKGGEALPRRAGISSFGAGGANAHVILEEYRGGAGTGNPGTGTPQPVVISARTEAQLDAKVKDLAQALRGLGAEQFLPAVYTLQTGREAFAWRLGFRAADLKEMRETLEACAAGKKPAGAMKNQVVRSPETVRALEAQKEQAAAAMARGDLQALTECWVRGADVEWEKLYEGKAVPRISLPTYPFDRTVYCAIDRMKELLFPKEDAAKAPEAVPLKAPQTETDEYALMAFEQQFIPEPLSAYQKEPRCVLCFAQSADLRQNAREEASLLDSGIRLVWAQNGGEYARLDADNYTVDYDRKETIRECIRSVLKDCGSIRQMLYLSPLEDGLWLRDLTPLMRIVQAAAEAEASGVHLLVAGACRNELDRVYAESLIGMDRSVGMTSLNGSIGTVILDEQGADTGSVLNRMMAECLADTAESVLYENGTRKKLKISPLHLSPAEPCRIRKDGTYLITGGMGGLGLIFAKHLSARYRANLVLCGRRPADAVADKLNELRQGGMSVEYVSADASRADQLRAAVETAVSRFGRLDGVIHAAGLPEGKNFLEKEEAEFRRILQPKIQGTLALEEALTGIRTDFVCYFSSISAVLGDFGSFDYAVGNRFMMSYGAYRRAHDRFPGETYVIGWPFWHDGGMGFKTKTAERMYMRTSGQMGLTADTGAGLLDLLLSNAPLTCFAMYAKPDRAGRLFGMTPGEIDRARVSWEAEVPAAANEPAPVSGQASAEEAAPPAAEAPSAGRAWIMDRLQETVREILGVSSEQMDENMILADFGFDSVTLGQFAEKVTGRLSVKVTPDLFYRYTTLNELAGYLLPRYRVPVSDKAPAAAPAAKEQPGTQASAAAASGNAPAAGTEMNSGIAIVGISGKFPDADDPEELWKILSEGREVVREAPDRVGWEVPEGVSVRIGAIRRIDLFDPGFFEISPKEACFMDPRQRLLLEESWKALEDAGVGGEEVQNARIGMFVGAEEGDYLLLSSSGSITSNHNAVLAARIAYFLNFHGPNMCINTACSSGLVALHQACQSLRTGECDIAIAAGVNLFCTHVLYEGMEKAGMLSPSGSCYPFDRRADGMIPAEAIAVVVLKRTETARRDRDRIYGEIIASAVNYDGRTNGITAPSGKAQAQLMEETYRRFGVDPKEVDYLVSHGTGTRVGDPIELNAVTEAYQKMGVPNGNCALTSTKANIGHALAASGVVSLISLALALKHETIPGEIHCEEPSDYIRWEDSPFVLRRENQPWKDGAKRRVGAVNAFGMSGTNVHVVVGSVPETPMKPGKAAAWFLPFSAKNRDALKALCRSMAETLRGKTDADLPAVSYTLLHGRQHFSHRAAVVAADIKDAVKKLEAYLAGGTPEQVYTGEVERNFRPKEKTLKITEMLCGQVNTSPESDKTHNSLNMLGQIYCRGILPSALYRDLNVIRVSLPGYPLERKSYWIPEQMRTRTAETPGKAETPKAPEPGKTPEPVEKPEPVKKPELVKVPESVKAPETVPKIPAAPAAAPAMAKKDQPAAERKAPAGGKEKDMGTENARGAGQSMEEVLKELASSLAKELFMEEEEVSYDRSFLEMGLDSIVGVEWIRHLNKTYQMNLESTRLYQYPTLTELAAYILSLRAEPEAGTVPAAESVPAEAEAENAGKLIPPAEAAFDPTGAASLELKTVQLAPLDNSDAVPVPAEKPAAPAKPAVPAKPAPDLEAVMKDLAESLARELFMDVGDVRYDQGFMEIGLDSIVGVEWMRHINRQYCLNIESTKIYQYPTIAELAQYIASLPGDVPEAPAPESAPEQPAPVQPAPAQPSPAAPAPVQAAPAQATETGEDLDSLLEKIYSGEMDIDQAGEDLF